MNEGSSVRSIGVVGAGRWSAGPPRGEEAPFVLGFAFHYPDERTSDSYERVPATRRSPLSLAYE